MTLLLEVAGRDERLAQMLLVKSAPSGGRDALVDNLHFIKDSYLCNIYKGQRPI